MPRSTLFATTLIEFHIPCLRSSIACDLFKGGAARGFCSAPGVPLLQTQISPQPNHSISANFFQGTFVSGSVSL